MLNDEQLENIMFGKHFVWVLYCLVVDLRGAQCILETRPMVWNSGEGRLCYSLGFVFLGSSTKQTEGANTCSQGGIPSELPSCPVTSPMRERLQMPS